MELTEPINKNKNRILNIALIILAFVIASNIYKKQTKEIESLQAKIDLEIKKNGVLKNIGQLEKEINSYKNFLTKKDSNLIMNTIGNIAKEVGVKIVSIRPNLEQSYPDYIKFPFDLVLSASNYHAIGKFISELESHPDVYVIETLGIRPEYQTKELTVNLKLSTVQFAD